MSHPRALVAIAFDCKFFREKKAIEWASEHGFRTDGEVSKDNGKIFIWQGKWKSVTEAEAIQCDGDEGVFEVLAPVDVSQEFSSGSERIVENPMAKHKVSRLISLRDKIVNKWRRTIDIGMIFNDLDGIEEALLRGVGLSKILKLYKNRFLDRLLDDKKAKQYVNDFKKYAEEFVKGEIKKVQVAKKAVKNPKSVIVSNKVSDMLNAIQDQFFLKGDFVLQRFPITKTGKQKPIYFMATRASQRKLVPSVKISPVFDEQDDLVRWVEHNILPIWMDKNKDVKQTSSEILLQYGFRNPDVNPKEIKGFAIRTKRNKWYLSDEESLRFSEDIDDAVIFESRNKAAKYIIASIGVGAVNNYTYPIIHRKIDTSSKSFKKSNPHSSNINEGDTVELVRPLGTFVGREFHRGDRYKVTSISDTGSLWLDGVGWVKPEDVKNVRQGLVVRRKSNPHKKETGSFFEDLGEEGEPERSKRRRFASIAKELFGKRVSDLSDREFQTISRKVNLISGRLNPSPTIDWEVYIYNRVGGKDEVIEKVDTQVQAFSKRREFLQNKGKYGIEKGDRVHIRRVSNVNGNPVSIKENPLNPGSQGAEKVVKAWIDGRSLKIGPIRTNGKELFSFDLMIGYSEVNVQVAGFFNKVAIDYSPESDAQISTTTTRHVIIAKSKADKVIVPETPSFRVRGGKVVERNNPKTWMGKVSDVDDFGHPIIDVFIDGMTSMGSWAIMSPEAFDIYGIGLGLGKGQKYEKQSDGSWLKKEKEEEIDDNPNIDIVVGSRVVVINNQLDRWIGKEGTVKKIEPYYSTIRNKHLRIAIVDLDSGETIGMETGLLSLVDDNPVSEPVKRGPRNYRSIVTHKGWKAVDKTNRNLQTSPIFPSYGQVVKFIRDIPRDPSEFNIVYQRKPSMIGTSRGSTALQSLSRGIRKEKDWIDTKKGDLTSAVNEFVGIWSDLDYLPSRNPIEIVEYVADSFDVNVKDLIESIENIYKGLFKSNPKVRPPKTRKSTIIRLGFQSSVQASLFFSSFSKDLRDIAEPGEYFIRRGRGFVDIPDIFLMEAQRFAKSKNYDIINIFYPKKGT